jgi:dTDP-4-amino-4,6-dideoxygalactose transaminase
LINVTKTHLPSSEKYKEYVDKIFENGWVTNNGPMVKDLELRLAEYLGVKNVVLVANGTVALEIAYRALGIRGYAITTPFSFVATTSSLVTNGLKPIFADIDPETLNIDPSNIEGLITPNTSAIVPAHVFGNICDVDKIDDIAKKNNLKVVYDAAHAFDVKFRGESVLKKGDISTLSFHATKIFHTIEGGALIVNDEDLVKKVRYLINFGIRNQESIPELGTNAKMNEFEAAMGLCMLDEMTEVLKKRECLYARYKKELNGLVKLQANNPLSSPSYSYFPVVFKSEVQRIKVQDKLNENNIFPRRYFFPSLDTLSYIEPKQTSPISRDISGRILSLPLYPELKYSEQSLIIDVVRGAL